MTEYGFECDHVTDFNFVAKLGRSVRVKVDCYHANRYQVTVHFGMKIFEVEQLVSGVEGAVTLQ